MKPFDSPSWCVGMPLLNVSLVRAQLVQSKVDVSNERKRA